MNPGLQSSGKKPSRFALSMAQRRGVVLPTEQPSIVGEKGTSAQISSHSDLPMIKDTYDIDSERIHAENKSKLEVYFSGS